MPLDIGPLQSTGQFTVSAATPLSAQLIPDLPTQSQFPMNGLGFWDEIGQAVSFSVAGATPGGNLATSVTLVLAGHQVSPPVGADPAQDQVCHRPPRYRMRAPDGPYSGGTPRSPKYFDRHAGDTVSTPEMVELMRASGVPTPEWFAVASKSDRAAIRPPPEFAVAPPQSARAPLPYRRCTDEHGGIEYGGLPVDAAILSIPVQRNGFQIRKGATTIPCRYRAAI